MTNLLSRIAAWAKEAKRRRVYMSVIGYAIVAVTIIELSGAIFDALLLPDWSSRLVTVLLILGFPMVVVLAWIFDVTPEGVKRTDELDSAKGADADEGGAAKAVRPKAKRGGRETTPRVRRVAKGGSRSADPAPSPGAPLAKPSFDEEGSAPGPPPDAEQVKRATLAHVRHELKTPINAILGYSEMLLEDLEDDTRGMEGDLNRIHTAGRSLLGLVDEILSPARVAEEGASTGIEDYGAKIRADLRNPINAVIGYAELLIETSEEEEGLEYMIADLERIRAAAQRLLELSTDIVEVATSEEARAGRLEAASAMTSGVMAKARVESGTELDEAMGSLLVVDDNAMNRDLLSRQLARAGYVVQTAESGAEALELLGQRDFDLVLLDVIMPEIDGLDVLRRVKSDGHMARTPVMMLSSLDDVESAIRCIELGAEDFLHKPFHPTLLKARIGSALEIRRMRDEELRQRARLDESEAFAHRLLRSSFPEAIAERIRAGESDIVESYGAATVFWCDVDGAARSHARDAAQVAGRIQHLLEAIERVTEEHALETLASVGDGVVAAAGVPVPEEGHAERVAAAALALTDSLLSDRDFDAPVRVGVDSGEVTAGVMGGERLGYRLWGDPVDLARSLGAQADHGQVLVSPGAYRLLKDRWTFASPGVQEIPGRGQMKTYILEGPA